MNSKIIHYLLFFSREKKLKKKRENQGFAYKFPSTQSVPPQINHYHPSMGFLCHAIKFPAILTASFFLSIWSELKWMIIGALTHLGLYKPPPEEDDSNDNSNNYIFILDGTSPSLVPIPIHVVTAAIKNKVPVLQYQDFQLKRFGDQTLGGQFHKLCTICLEPLEATQEVRDLCRCSHVFHRNCLDGWVDSGQVTCPLCRSMLLPPRTNLSRCGGDQAKTEESNPPQSIAS